MLYGLTRIAMTLLVQVREGMFAKVAMHAVRKLALTTFEHMHRLSLRFHLERKTGGLTRVLERGRAGIENITRMTLMTFVPTIVEFALVLARADARVRLALCRSPSAAMIALYLWFTVRATDWRIKIRRTMNESDTEANTKAIDSLLNYETVKYFGAEEREAQRYDKSMAVYEEASVKSYTSLAVLNAGQAVDLHRSRSPLCMVMAGLDVAAGQQDGRPVRDGQRADAAAVHPAQLHGHGVSRDQAVADRHRAHDGRAGREPGGGGPPGCGGARAPRAAPSASRT